MTSLVLLVSLVLTSPTLPEAQNEPAVEQVLEGGVLRGPPMPEGCEWLPNLVHREVERSTQPLRDAIRGLREAVRGAIDAVVWLIRVVFWTAVALVVLLLVAIVAGLLLAWRIYLVTWNVSPLIGAVTKTLERLAAK